PMRARSEAIFTIVPPPLFAIHCPKTAEQSIAPINPTCRSATQRSTAHSSSLSPNTLPSQFTAGLFAALLISPETRNEDFLICSRDSLTSSTLVISQTRPTTVPVG